MSTKFDYLGHALRRFRRLRRLRQIDVARAGGFTRPMVSAYEHGRTRPSLESLWKLLDSLGVSLAELEDEMRVRQRDREIDMRVVRWLLERE